MGGKTFWKSEAIPFLPKVKYFRDKSVYFFVEDNGFFSAIISVVHSISPDIMVKVTHLGDKKRTPLMV